MPRPRRQWTAEQDAVIRSRSAAAAADTLNLPRRTVERRRQELGVAPETVVGWRTKLRALLDSIDRVGDKCPPAVRRKAAAVRKAMETV